MDNIYIGFNPDGGNTEGFGSMAQHVIHTFCLSKYLGINFYFLPFKNITHYQYYNVTQEHWHKDFENLFNFPTSNIVFENDEIITYSGDLHNLQNVINQNINNKKLILINSRPGMDFAKKNILKIFDAMPELKNRLNLNYYNSITYFNKESVNVAIHIRRYTKTDEDPSSCRELYTSTNFKNTYFINLIKKIDKLLENRRVEYHIYSQGNDTEFEHFKDIPLLNKNASIHLHIEEYLMITLAHLIFADIFVMSNSSLSYIAHLYSDGISIIRDNFWLNLHPNTIKTDIHGNFDENKFITLTNTLHNLNNTLDNFMKKIPIYDSITKKLLIPDNKKIKIDVGLSYCAPNSALWVKNLQDRLIFGFEPNIECIEHIKSGFGYNGVMHLDPCEINKTVYIIECALDNCETKYKKFYSTHGDLGASSLYKPKEKFRQIKNIYDVLCIKLEKFLDIIPWEKVKYIEHIKIDAQGNDLRILESAGNYLFEKIVFVTIESANEANQYDCNEIHSGHSRRQVIDFMTKNNFQPYSSPICDLLSGKQIYCAHSAGGNLSFVNKKFIHIIEEDKLDCSHLGA